LRTGRIQRSEQGNPQLSLAREVKDRGHFFAVRKHESGRHDADDGVSEAIEIDGAADGRGITAEVIHPQTIAQDGFQLVAGFFFLFGESAAEKRRNAERREKSSRGTDTVKTEGIAGASEVEGVRLKGAEAVEGCGAALEGDEVALAPGKVRAE